MVHPVPMLGDVALMGQSTVIYAKPNTGKTLITLQMIVQGIRERRFEPSNLYYINMDDDGNGLVEKLRIAGDYGFHMLADGYEEFSVRKFQETMTEMIHTGTAQRTMVVLDTLTKFVDPMDKKASRNFAALVRRFVMQGGTVVALAHTNKNPDSHGNVVYAGTTDIVDNFDCVHTLSELPQHNGAEKTVIFKKLKSRGGVAEAAAYSYALGKDISYSELLSSVRVVNPEEFQPLVEAADMMSDSAIIEVAEACIREGITQKMRLRDEIAQRAKVSERQAIHVIEKYAGSDPAQHRWNYTVRARGAKVFALLSRTNSEASA